VLHRLGLESSRFVYVTLHRPSNVDGQESLRAIVECLRGVAEGLPVVFPLHPRTRQRLLDFDLLNVLQTGPGMRLIEPLGYLDSIGLADQASCVLTDSGGLQEETTFLRVPCLTLRPNTERPVTITQGSNRLSRLATLRTDLEDAIRRRESGESSPCPALWDGRAAERIADTLLER
jgi:UDP-N-acetylglucosamine 2-epimerase (non-hydrolysing)